MSVARAGRRRLLYLAAMTYLVSWCVPVARIPGELVGGRVWGWQAFLFAMSPALGHESGEPLLTNAWMVASALSNVLVLAAVGLSMRGRTKVTPVGLTWGLAAACLVNLVWLARDGAWHELRAGYYLWIAGFVLATVDGFVGTRRGEYRDIGRTT